MYTFTEISGCFQPGQADVVLGPTPLAQTVLGQLARGVHCRDRHVIVRLYQQYVRPHLEFVSPAWSPWQEGDKECLEKVLKRAMGSGHEDSTNKYK